MNTGKRPDQMENPFDGPCCGASAERVGNSRDWSPHPATENPHRAMPQDGLCGMTTPKPTLLLAKTFQDRQFFVPITVCDLFEPFETG